MSIRLLLENFLGLMKEEGELDVFLPMLIVAMGHEMITYAQKGVRQYGVDLVSFGNDPTDGNEKLFLWLVKCGNIGRTEWNNGNQSIKPSIDDVGNVFLKTHILPQHKNSTRKLVVVTNGEYKSEISLTLSQYLDDWTKNNNCESEIVGGSNLAKWTETYLLDENVLPIEHHALFRRALANIASPDVCVPVGRQLIQEIFTKAADVEVSIAKRRKNILAAFRGVRTALAVIFLWAQNEGSMESARQLAEFGVLEAWSRLQSIPEGENSLEVKTEFMELYFHMLTVGEMYAVKVAPYLNMSNALAFATDDALITTDLAFRELGQLGFQGIIWAFHAWETEGKFSELALQYTQGCSTLIANTLKTHGCTRSPSFDHHILDIHTALLCLMVNKKEDVAVDWIMDLVERLDLISINHLRYWPVHAEFDELLEIRKNSKTPTDEMMAVSTLLPILALWCAALNLEFPYKIIRETILPRISGTTLNMWSADETFDKIVNDQYALHSSGFGHPFKGLPPSPQEYISMLGTTAEEIPSVSESIWHKERLGFIPLLAARHWKLQIPKQALVAQTLVFTKANMGEHA